MDSPNTAGMATASILATIAGDDLVLSAGQSVNDGVYITSKLVEAYRNATVDRTAFQASAQRVVIYGPASPANRYEAPGGSQCT